MAKAKARKERPTEAIDAQSDESLLMEIQASVAELARRAGIGPDRAFAAWYAVHLLDTDEDDALEAAALDGGEDQGVDFLYTDHTNERIVVLQAHFPNNPTKATPKAKWDGLTAAIPHLEKPVYFKKAGRPELASAAEEAQEYVANYELIMGVVSIGNRSDQIVRSVHAFNDNTRYRGYHFFYDHQGTIRDRYRAVKAGARSVAEDTLRFDGGRYFTDSGDFGHAWVGTVAAEELNRLYKKYDDRLFARNVRLYLGTRKGGINEQVVETARTSPGKFWALNNGITIVADTATEQDKDPGQFKLTRFSIVNGCQTTVSLSKAGAPSPAKVLVRVVAASQAVVSDIVRFNNTQNAVRIWTVRAADKIQEALRNSFLKIGVDYAPKPEGSRSQPKGDKVISLDRIAQFLAARNSNTLIAAVKEKSELFDRYYPDVFAHGISAEDVYLTWQLGVLADSARQERLDDLTRQKDNDKTLTALLGVAGTYWTVFCASKFVQDLNQQPMKLTLQTMDADAFRNALRKYVSRGLDEYISISIDTYEVDEYRSVRSALRSPRFLQKFVQKLANKTAVIKKEKKTLPQLDGALQAGKAR
jgi:hypothetical protein